MIEFKNKALQEFMEGVGVKFRIHPSSPDPMFKSHSNLPNLEVDLSYSDLRALHKPIISRTYFDHAVNRAKINEIGKQPQFSGGSHKTYEEGLAGDFEFQEFEERKNKIIENWKVEGIIPNTMITGTRRRRLMSAYDGDWDMSKKWELNPFSSSYRDKVHSPVVDLEIFAGFNCNTSVESLTEYGLRVWGILTLLEASGHNVKLILRYPSAYPTESNNTDVKVVIKEYNEYIAQPVLAFAFHPTMFRIGQFCLTVALADLLGLEVDSSFGQSRSPEVIKVTPGKISIAGETSNLNGNTIKNIFNQFEAQGKANAG